MASDHPVLVASAVIYACLLVKDPTCILYTQPVNLQNFQCTMETSCSLSSEEHTVKTAHSSGKWEVYERCEWCKQGHVLDWVMKWGWHGDLLLGKVWLQRPYRHNNHFFFPIPVQLVPSKTSTLPVPWRGRSWTPFQEHLGHIYISVKAAAQGEVKITLVSGC